MQIMKRVSRRNLLLLSGVFVLLVAACKKDDTPTFDDHAQFMKDTAAISAYIIANNLVATKDAASGIFYNIETPGNGVDSVKHNNTTITVLYRGNVMGNPAAFDSTGTTSRQFTYGGLIRGFQFGLSHISKGGKIKVYIPSYWGYGNQAWAGIPANSILVFDINMIDVVNP
jgi:FKBP-type peptidyl-prolyl cis-trans isomerase